jgi:hypothetical protein
MLPSIHQPLSSDHWLSHHRTHPLRYWPISRRIRTVFSQASLDTSCIASRRDSVLHPLHDGYWLRRYHHGSPALLIQRGNLLYYICDLPSRYGAAYKDCRFNHDNGDLRWRTLSRYPRHCCHVLWRPGRLFRLRSALLGRCHISALFKYGPCCTEAS